MIERESGLNLDRLMECFTILFLSFDSVNRVERQTNTYMYIPNKVKLNQLIEFNLPIYHVKLTLNFP